MRQHPAILEKMDAIVIVSNSGDFVIPSSWASDLTHPLHHPFPGLISLARKYVFPPSRPPQVKPEMQVALRDWQQDLHALSQTFKKPIYIFMYPNLAEFHDAVIRQSLLDSKIPLIQAQLGNAAKIYKVANDGNWNEVLYRDNIHPSGNGNQVLAGIFQKDMCLISIKKMMCK
jgi:lysophospholipase L1-like esterase